MDYSWLSRFKSSLLCHSQNISHRVNPNVNIVRAAAKRYPFVGLFFLILGSALVYTLIDPDAFVLAYFVECCHGCAIMVKKTYAKTIMITRPEHHKVLFTFSGSE